MSRPKRIDLPFSLYHILSRTNTGDVAFTDGRDEGKFLSYIEKYTELFSFSLHAFCLMPTHFHLLLESSNRATLSEFMRRLLTAYTIYFNRRHKRHGHLFQGRFKSYIVDKSNYFLALSRYIHLNPSEAGLKGDFETYPGSSLRYYIQGGEPAFLLTREILAYFKGNRKAYARFIREGLNKETKPPILKQSYISENPFAQKIRKRVGYLRETESRAHRAMVKNDEALREKEEKSAEKILDHVARYFGIPVALIKKRLRARGDLGKARALAVILLRDSLPWTCREITEYLGLKGKRDINTFIKKAAQEEALKHIGKIIKDTIDK